MSSDTKNKPERTKEIKVQVTFPLGPRGPYHDKVDQDESVGTVRQAAMAHFGVQEDPSSTYYLTSEGTRADDSQAIGKVADKERQIKFSLVKELIQG